jgi:hypothetical protein
MDIRNFPPQERNTNPPQRASTQTLTQQLKPPPAAEICRNTRRFILLFCLVFFSNCLFFTR